MSAHEDSEGAPNSFEELEKKFRQERKSLQAKIQVLKKSASKGDKKKKKEVQEEIAKLEADLDQRQNEEEEKLNQKLPNGVQEAHSERIVGTEDDAKEDSIPAQKVTKAAKRRQKREAANKERDSRIQEQDEANLLGPRHKEMVAIVQKLRERDLSIHNIVADGNCLYSAVEHQLKETNGSNDLDYKALRKLTANYLRQHKDDFLPFLSHDSGDSMSEEDFGTYCNKVEKSTAWGGQIELRAISDALACPIEVIQATGPTMTIGEQYVKKPLIVTFHRFLYRLGEHYNSVAPYVEDDQDN